jgi:hypothetical protein
MVNLAYLRICHPHMGFVQVAARIRQSRHVTDSERSEAESCWEHMVMVQKLVQFDNLMRSMRCQTIHTRYASPARAVRPVQRLSSILRVERHGYDYVHPLYVSKTVT